jgi:hypothetical protein
LRPFGPRKTKRQVFDRRLATRAGSWMIRASFNGVADTWRLVAAIP